MAGRAALRSITRRFSGSGKILSEEEKAAKNVYIIKVYIKGLKPEAAAEPGSGSGFPPVSDAAKTSGAEASSSKLSFDKNGNYYFMVGALTGYLSVMCALGWYLKFCSKKTEEVQE